MALVEVQSQHFSTPKCALACNDWFGKEEDFLGLGTSDG